MVLCSCDRSYVANREALVELWCVRVHGDLSDGRLRRLFAAKGVWAFFAPTLNYKLPLTLAQLTLHRGRSGYSLC